MVASACTAVLDVCFLRVAQLTTGGVPQTGAGFGYTTDTPQKVVVGLDIEAGQEFKLVDGCGDLASRIKEPDKIKGANFQLTLSLLERDLLHLMCGGTLFASGATTGGYQVPLIADAAPNPVYVEMWAKAISGNSQAVTAITTPNAAYHQFVMPYVICTQQPFTLQNGFTTFDVNGVGSENSNATANGPWNDLPSWVAGKGGITAVIGEFETGTIPTAACALQAVPAGS